MQTKLKIKSKYLRKPKITTKLSAFQNNNNCSTKVRYKKTDLKEFSKECNRTE